MSRSWAIQTGLWTEKDVWQSSINRRRTEIYSCENSVSNVKCGLFISVYIERFCYDFENPNRQLFINTEFIEYLYENFKNLHSVPLLHKILTASIDNELEFGMQKTVLTKVTMLLLN